MVLADLYYEIARDMPEDDVAKEMHKDDLLTPEEWETYRRQKTDKGEFLLDCLRKRKSGFLQRFCIALQKAHADSLATRISHHRQGTNYINGIASCCDVYLFTQLWPLRLQRTLTL